MTQGVIRTAGTSARSRETPPSYVVEHSVRRHATRNAHWPSGNVVDNPMYECLRILNGEVYESAGSTTKRSRPARKPKCTPHLDGVLDTGIAPRVPIPLKHCHVGSAPGH